MSKPQQDIIAALRIENERLREALVECVDALELSDPEGHRAAHIAAPEDPAVKDLCERHGFGAVMDSAARQWRNHPAYDNIGRVSAYTTGACVGTVQKCLKQARAALKEKP